MFRIKIVSAEHEGLLNIVDLAGSERCEASIPGAQNQVNFLEIAIELINYHLFLSYRLQRQHRHIMRKSFKTRQIS